MASLALAQRFALVSTLRIILAFAVRCYVTSATVAQGCYAPHKTAHHVACGFTLFSRPFLTKKMDSFRFFHMMHKLLPVLFSAAIALGVVIANEKGYLAAIGGKKL